MHPMHAIARYTLHNGTAAIPGVLEQIEREIRRHNVADPTSLRRVGIALHEALTNAVLHGNLELRSTLREQNEVEFYRLSQERQLLSPYQNRRVSVTVFSSSEEWTFVIRDEGNGFDLGSLGDPTTHDNVSRPSGRGLLLIRTFMDRVQHNALGNEISMSKRFTRHP